MVIFFLFEYLLGNQRSLPRQEQNMNKSLQELADILGGRLFGDPSVRISGLGTLDSAVKGEITFLANPKYAAKVAST